MIALLNTLEPILTCNQFIWSRESTYRQAIHAFPVFIDEREYILETQLDSISVPTARVFHLRDDMAQGRLVKGRGLNLQDLLGGRI